MYLWPILLFLILPLLAFPEIIFGRQTLYWSDLSWIHYPRHIFAAEEWLAGRVPLWDPFQHNGLPLLAEAQVGALYPISGLFLGPLSPSLELSLYILVHFVLAAIFTFILARSLEMGVAAATVAGLTFGFGGFLMAQVANLNIMTGAVWLPLILAGVILTCRQRSWLVALLAGIPLALQIFTAQPQIVFYTLITICGYGLYRVVADLGQTDLSSGRRIRATGHTIALLAVTILSGLLLAAPQLLPTLELQQLSVRSQERGLGFLTENSLPPLMWLNLLMPSTFGNNVTGFKGGDPFQEDFIYAGFIPLLLALFSLGQRRRRDLPFFILLLIGGALLAMGRATPLYQSIVQFLPGFALFRIPARWLMVVNLALAVLAGFGMQQFLQKGLSRRQLAAILLWCGFLAVALGLSWMFREDLVNLSRNWSEFYQKSLAVLLDGGYSINPIYRHRLLMSWLIGLTVPVFLLVTNLVITAIIFTLYATHKISASTFSTLLIIGLSLDLIAAGGTTINPTQPDSWWHQLSGGAQYVLDHVEDERVFPLGMGSEKLTVSHLGQYFPSVYRVRSAGGHGSSLMLHRIHEFLDKAHPVQAIRLLGVRYVLTEGRMGEDAAATYPIAYSDDASYVYENQAPTPRVFVVHEVIGVDTPAKALAYFETANLDPLQTAVLETKAELPRPEPAPARSTATIARETTQALEIEVDAAADGYLVLLDTYYPGWVAQVDGATTSIHRANYVGRAVFVPAGSHTVTFEYRPFSFALGVGLALLGLLSLTGLTVSHTRRVRTLK
jgi:hypothetical protein